MDFYNKYRGNVYKLQIQEYLTINYLNYQSYLWKNIPFYTFSHLKYRFIGLKCIKI